MGGAVGGGGGKVGTILEVAGTAPSVFELKCKFRSLFNPADLFHHFVEQSHPRFYFLVGKFIGRI